MISNILDNKKIQNRFTDKAFFRFFWPVFISNFCLALGGIADCFFVGMKMQAEGLSAIALGIPIYLFYNVLSYGLSIGGSIHYATALANGHPEEGNRIFNNVLKFLFPVYLITVALGIIFLDELLVLLGADPTDAVLFSLAGDYVRTQLICVPILYLQGPAFYFLSCDGAPKKAAVAMIVSNVLDISFNYIFIVVMGMGPEGSVWSTLVGAVAMLIICSTHIFGKKGELRFSRSKFSFQDIEKSGGTGLSTAIQYVYLFITTLVANKLLMQYSGSEGVAAFDIIYNLTLFTDVIANSMDLGFSPMIQSFKAEKNGTAVQRTFQIGISYGVILTIFETFAIIALAKPFCSLFGLLSNASYTTGTGAITLYSLSIIPAVLNECTIYYDQAANREKSAFVLTTLRTFVFWLISMIAILHFAPEYFFATYLCAEVLTLIVVLLGHGSRKKDWAKDDTPRYEFVITTNTDLGALVEDFNKVCDSWDCLPQHSYYGTLILEELCAAIIQDAKSKNETGISIIGTALHQGDEVSLFIRDDSVRFNPFELKGENEEDTIDLGVNIVRKKAKEFFYRRYQGFNTLVVRM